MLNAALNDGSRKKPGGTPSVSRIAGAMLLGALGAVALVVTSGSVHSMLLTSESAPSRVTDVEPLTVYYWPMWGRAGHVFWMLDEAEYPYVHVSDKEHIAEVASAFGAMNDTFAPPIVKDGDFLLSQSVALAIYLGEKLGFDHGVPDNFKAMQHLSDLLDFFNEAGKAATTPQLLHEFVDGAFFGARFDNWVGNIERSIVGPYYYGEEITYVDFFMANCVEWAHNRVFDAVEPVTGDKWAGYPKVNKVLELVRQTRGYKVSKLAHVIPPYIATEDFVAEFSK